MLIPKAVIDYSKNKDVGTLVRMLRYFCIFISLLAPSLYVAISFFESLFRIF
ncbi:spore germination protein [Paenibacillus sp. FSL K6-0276]|uniref:spore germination protein n=1 Tax=unclassified Paenibacillus TaxID=185978 RepID=UPI0028A8BB60|nr:spore germination protein [Paenibacillus sp.]